jgi:hypothetical protein
MADEKLATQRRRKMSWPVIVMLLLPYAGLCFPSLYARTSPVLLGFPFFYWYQFVWVVVTSLLLYAVYRRLKEPS